MPSPTCLRGLFPSALVASLFLAACGARGPLDITVIQEVEGPEASTDAAVVEASTDAADASDAAEAGKEGGTFGIDGGPLINCGECVAQSCGSQVLTCIESPNCLSAIQCAVTTCLSGGSLDPSCIEGCANGDLSALGDLVGTFTCVIGTCGAQCTSVLGGLGGLGGGGGAGGGGGGGSGG
jgi:predicted small lipoprotein YifL